MASDDSATMWEQLRAIMALGLPPELERGELLHALGGTPRLPTSPVRVCGRVDPSTLELILASDIPRNGKLAALKACIKEEFDRRTLEKEIDQCLLCLVALEASQWSGASQRNIARKVETRIRRYERAAWPRQKHQLAVEGRNATDHRLLRYSEVFRGMKLPRCLSAIQQRIAKYNELRVYHEKIVADANRATISQGHTDVEPPPMQSTDVSGVGQEEAFMAAQSTHRDAFRAHRALTKEAEDIRYAITILTSDESELARFIPACRERGEQYLAKFYPNYPAIKPNVQRLFDALELADERRYEAGKVLREATATSSMAKQVRSQRQLADLRPRYMEHARQVQGALVAVLAMLDAETELHRERARRSSLGGFDQYQHDLVRTHKQLLTAAREYLEVRKRGGRL